MKLQFDSTLQYQQDAVNAIVKIFAGQEKIESNFSVYSTEYTNTQGSFEYDKIGYANKLMLTEGQLVENIQHIQLSNGLLPSLRKEIERERLDFTIEMETGTGKTYVYLRTIMELYRNYGFSKHIIVVPSIAIKEGVYKSLQITEAHFKQLYQNINYHYFVYDSSNLADVRSFAVNNTLEIMVINIDAFRKSFENPEEHKKTNIIHRHDESLGHKPLDLIQNTRPMVFIDEPQSTMNTVLAKKAVQGLHPMAIIRYSATHREKVNLMYKLDAVDAYEKKLVKQIEVASVQAETVASEAYIKLLSIKIHKGSPVARVEVDVFKNRRIQRKTITVKQNTDLEQYTDRLEYEGYIVRGIYDINDYQYIDFTGNDIELSVGQSIGGVDDLQVKTLMIRKTIEEHLDKELILNPLGLKVLSLFFVDSVSKYRIYNEQGEVSNGVYAKIFEQEYAKAIKRTKYASLFGEIKDYEQTASEVHNGYFSMDRKSKAGKKGDKYEYYKDTKGNTKADEDTYSLIMKDKEKLLSFDSKLRFIFSHSALKEGWDNPNVFQICTLKDAGKSDIRRRQEIGRGLRLSVNQKGERVQGFEVNTLTVLASESYTDFVENLQKEIEKDTGIRFGIVEAHTFNNVVVEIEDTETNFLGQESSEQLFDFLILKNYIDKKGKVQDSLRTALKEEKVELPEEYTEQPHIYKQILQRLKTAAGKLEIKNGSNKKKVSVNARILNSPEFKALWDRVKYKTTFSVDFDSDELITACIQALDNNISIKRGKLHYKKAALQVSMGGLKPKEIATKSTNLKVEVKKLPDIVSYLQNETQLTRKSIVEILSGTIKLDHFKTNPQKFIEAAIALINEQMRLHIIDGIKYKKVGDNEYFSQELFQNEELFGYLKSNLKESTKSPYDYVVYDSKIESNLMSEFEKSENIPVYTKLPYWFKIDTPLGTYNPDWAILWKDDKEEKLYFVVESKGSTNLEELRPKEKAKILCGKRHFEAIGSEMIVAKEIKDIEDFALQIEDK